MSETELIDRIKLRLSTYPQDKPLFITMNGNLTPRQVIEEIEKGSAVGKRILATEKLMKQREDQRVT